MFFSFLGQPTLGEHGVKQGDLTNAMASEAFLVANDVPGNDGAAAVAAAAPREVAGPEGDLQAFGAWARDLVPVRGPPTPGALAALAAVDRGPEPLAKLGQERAVDRFPRSLADVVEAHGITPDLVIGGSKLHKLLGGAADIGVAAFYSSPVRMLEGLERTRQRQAKMLAGQFAGGHAASLSSRTGAPRRP